MKVISIDDASKLVCGHTVWRAQKGHGTFLTIDAGRRHQDLTHPERPRLIGDIHIWVYLANWRLLADSETILDNQVHHSDEYSSSLNRLLGLTIDGLSLNGQALSLHFGPTLRLMMFPDLGTYEPDDDDVVIIFPWEQTAIGFRPHLGFHTD